MKLSKLFLLLIICGTSCNSKKESKNNQEYGEEKQVFIEKIDSIHIEYIGNPIVHDIDPKTKIVLFLEDQEYFQEILIADFEGSINEKFSKFGDMPDSYGKLLSPIFIDSDLSFMVFGYNGFSRYTFQGELISNVPLSEFHIPNYQKIVMGEELVKLKDKYLIADKGTRGVDYNKIHIHSDIYHFNLYDPKTGISEPIIRFPKSSIYTSGKQFYRYAWWPVYSLSDDKIYVTFGGEPIIYIYEGTFPFSLISIIPLNFSDYRYFEGKKSEDLEYNFISLSISSGRISNIKKVGDIFLVAYFQGYDLVDQEEYFANKSYNESKELRERLIKKYPTRIAIFDSLGNRLNDFIPVGLDASSMLLRDGQLWMMEQPDNEIEKDYFRLYRVGLKFK